MTAVEVSYPREPAVGKLWWVLLATGILWILIGLFVLGGIAAFTAPFQTFTILAALIGIFLVIKGSVDFVFGLAARHEVDLWWMTVVAGVIEIIIGIWAVGYPGRSAALLILWVGIGAIIRGIAEIVTGFHIRKGPEAVLV